MAIEEWIKIAEVIVSLIQVIIWPVVLLIILLFFKTSLKNFISNISEFNLKAGSAGIEASAKRQQIEAAALLGAASMRKSSELEKLSTVKWCPLPVVLILPVSHLQKSGANME